MLAIERIESFISGMDYDAFVEDDKTMKNEKTKWSPVEVADIATGCSYLAFGISALLLASDLVATLLDGKLLPLRLLFDASFAG